MFKLKIDKESFKRQLQQAARAKHADFVNAMKAVAMQMEEESVKRAPIDEGHLQNSHRNEVIENGETITATTYIPSNAPASDYAWPMHEATYELGEASRQKQNSVGVRVGKKYMERALYEEHEKYMATLVRLLKRTF
jgi:hypothetical protein